MGSRGKSGGSVRYEDATDYNVFMRTNLQKLKSEIIDNGGDMSDVKAAWYDTRFDSERKSINEISVEDAISVVRTNISDSIRSGWFVNADSNYKPKLIEAILSNSGTLNAGFTIAYNNYVASTANPMPFNKWLVTPQTMYRGSRGQATVASDIFTSYTPNKSVAESFGSSIQTIKIRPIDTLGSYQTTGEQEFLVPVWRRRKG